ncbi:MAG TPA: extracellular solute-binding protein, partial [Spirochaetota bacterium]|nr:extracellular solute-binding protein [Spirochaetota bacterium]
MRNNANSEVIIKNLLEDFERENDLTVEVEVLDWGVAFGKISEALKNKKAPDVLQLGTTWIAYFADLGFLADLSVYSDEIDFTRFNSVNLETCKIFGSSSYYAVPWFIDVRAFFYNKEYMDSLNVKPSELNDYYDFKNYLYKIKEADFKINGKRVYPFGFSGKNDWNVVHNFAPWIWSEGGDFISFKDGNWQSSLFDKNTIKGICKYIDFYEEDLNSFEALKENSALIQQRFARGEYGTIFSVADIIKTIENEYLIGGESRSPLYKK